MPNHSTSSGRKRGKEGRREKKNISNTIVSGVNLECPHVNFSASHCWFFFPCLDSYIVKTVQLNEQHK